MPNTHTLRNVCRDSQQVAGVQFLPFCWPASNCWALLPPCWLHLLPASCFAAPVGVHTKKVPLGWGQGRQSHLLCLVPWQETLLSIMKQDLCPCRNGPAGAVAHAEGWCGGCSLYGCHLAAYEFSGGFFPPRSASAFNNRQNVHVFKWMAKHWMVAASFHNVTDFKTQLTKLWFPFSFASKVVVNLCFGSQIICTLRCNDSNRQIPIQWYFLLN